MSQTTDLTLLDSGVRTSTTYSPEFSWEDAKAFVVVNVTAISATPTITPFLQAYDATSSSWSTIWTAAVAKSPGGAATYTYIWTDTAFLPSGVTEAVQIYLTSRMRFGMTHADADSITYSVGCNRVNSNNLGI